MLGTQQGEKKQASDRIYQKERKEKMCKTKEELEGIVAEWRSLKAMSKELDDNLKALERDMMDYLDANEKTSEIGKDFTVKVSECERTTLDREKLEAAFGNLAAFSRVSQYRRLTVR